MTPSSDPSPPDPASEAPLLRIEAAVKRYGGVAAVDGLSFGVRRGTILGLIGPNGAGKTTMFDCLAGSQRLSSGRILLGDRPIEALPAHRRAGLGLGRTFQIPRPFGDMSVLDNVLVGAQDQRGERLVTALLRPGAVRRQEQALRDKAMQLLDFVTLAGLAAAPARVLSGGQRKLLELARVLIGDPSVLLLDEPAAGVNPALLEIIIDRIAAIGARGVTILLIEHNMDMVARLCARVVVMAQGRLLAEGSPAAVTQDPRVVDAYLGGVAA